MFLKFLFLVLDETSKPNLWIIYFFFGNFLLGFEFWVLDERSEFNFVYIFFPMLLMQFFVGFFFSFLFFFYLFYFTKCFREFQFLDVRRNV